MGQLVFQATAGGQVALVGPNPSSNFSLNVPAVNGNLVTTGDTGTVTNTMLASSAYTAPGTIGSGTPNSGAFTTLSASSTVSGTGFSTYLASPPAIGGTTPSTGKFTSITNTGLTATQVIYATTGGLETSSANMTFNGTSLTLANDASISGLTVGKGGGSVSTNTVVGNSAFNATNSGAYGTAIGFQAGTANTSGPQNTFIGGASGPANTTGGYNAAIGAFSFYQNTSGSYNSALGYDSLEKNTTGSYNTAVGGQALHENTTASDNTAVGYQAGYTTTTAQKSVFIGHSAGYSANSEGNVLVGNGAGYNLTSGAGNTFIGGSTSGAYYPSGYYITTGSKNSIFGAYNGNQGGLDIRTASNYIVLSDGDGNPRIYVDNNGQFVINAPTAGGNVLTARSASASSGMLVANANFTTGTAYFGYFVYNGSAVGQITSTGSTTLFTSLSDQRLKENIVDAGSGLAKLANVKVRSFDWKTNQEKTDFGLIAQELNEVAPEAVVAGVDKDDGSIDKPWQVDSSVLVPAMIKAIQELNAEVNALKAKLGA